MTEKDAPGGSQFLPSAGVECLADMLDATFKIVRKHELKPADIPDVLATALIAAGCMMAMKNAEAPMLTELADHFRDCVEHMKRKMALDREAFDKAIGDIRQRHGFPRVNEDFLATPAGHA